VPLLSIVRKLTPLRSALAACALLASSCGPPNETIRVPPQEISPPAGLAQPGFLTVAVPTDLPPYAQRRGGGPSQGFDVDLASQMAQRMGLKLSLVALDPQDLPAAARGGGVDIVLGTLPISPLLPPPPDLTLQPYLRASSVVVVTSDSPFAATQPSDLCGRAVTVVTGTPQEVFLAAASVACGRTGAIQPVPARTDADALRILHQQQAAAYVADAATAASDTQRDGTLTIASNAFDSGQSAMGLRQGGAVLNDAIIRDFYLVKSDGTFELLLFKWGLTALLL
jgi:ABC-type amino acid transport substrate-binding protein